MNKIKLLTISATCETGGSDINLFRLLKSLDRNEYDIFHLIPYAGSLADEFRNAGVRVKIADMPRIRFFKNPLRYIIVLLKFFPTVFKIKSIIEDYKIDIVCTSSMVNLYGVLAARLARRPHILIAGEYLFPLRLASPYFYFFSEKIICCSNLVSSMFKKSNKVLVKQHGLDLDEFSPNVSAKSLRNELGVSGGLVSMITRLARWKGVEVFIRAANYIELDVNFIIFTESVIGREKYLVKLKKMIQKLNLQKKVFIRSDKDKNIPQIMAASDIIVHASLRPEPFGLVIIEAMAMQKPVIASKLGGPLEIISDGVDGLLVEPGNPRILASAISMLLQDQKRAREIGINARKKVVKRFDLKGYASSLDRIFKEALKEYSLKHARLSIRRNTVLKISLPLAKFLVPNNPKEEEINKDITRKSPSAITIGDSRSGMEKCFILSCTIKKILVIQLFGMGDLICSIPLLQALKGYFNESKISLLIDTKLNTLTELIGYKDGIIGYNRGILSKAGLVSRIRRDEYDMVVILNTLFQGAWIAYLSQAKYRVGYIRDYEGIQNIERLSRLLTHPMLPVDKPLLDTQRYLEIARFLGIDAGEVLPRLNIPQEAVKWANEFLQDNRVEQKDFIFGINPHAAWESRCWDMQRFAEIADRIIEKYHAKVIFLGSSAANDRHRIDIIKSSMKHNAISAAGKTDMPKLAAILNRCSVFLTNDSGPMHLAWALGVNMVALFGPGDINKFGHKRENIINITANGPFCKPCILNYQYKDICTDNVCMKYINVSEVFKALDTLMNNKKIASR